MTRQREKIECARCGESTYFAEEHEGVLYCHCASAWTDRPTCWDRVAWYDAEYGAST